MSAPRNKAFNQWKNGFIRHYEPLTSVEAFVGGWDSRDAEVAAAKRQAEVAVADYEQAVKSYAIELSNRNAEVAALQANLTESQRLNAVAKGFIVVSKDLLAEAITCNTDASLADARHIINSVLKVSDDEIFREALKELEQ